MATVVSVVDDMDGSPDAHTYRFEWGGKSYDIDLAAANAQRVEAYFQNLISSGRPASTAAKLRKTPEVKSPGRETAPVPLESATPVVSEPVVDDSAKPQTDPSKAEQRRKRIAELAPVRQWAKESGYPLTLRGRVPNEILTKYNAAHPDLPPVGQWVS